jgi:lipopolysaccharide biosynthesis regulator YciM
MFDDLFSWLLLPACGVLGWAIAKRSGPGAGPGAVSSGRADAIGRLGVLIRDDTDEAVNALSKAIEAEPAAVELHLMLGSLFRRRGEIDRAIRVHESLLESPGLTTEQSGQTRLELARDYLKAGVVDRAETLGQSLLDYGALAGDGLELLLDLYEQTRDWPHAITSAEQWQAIRGRSAATRIAHYHCELAETARAAGDTEIALAQCQKALAIDGSCVRASMLMGALLEKSGDAPRALLAYAQAVEQSPQYVQEILTPMKRCAEASGEQREFASLLDAADKRKDAPIAIPLAKAQWLAAQGDEGPQQAARYLAEQLAARPDWGGLLQWIELSGGAQAAGDAWPAIKSSLQKRLSSQSGYFCSQCGFKTSVLFWQCPSCRTWSTIRPSV